MRVFRRGDLKRLRLHLVEQPPRELSVVRTEAYLFGLGVLVLVVELESPDALTLKQALDLQNVLRMVFPRRWKDGVPRESPLEACWLDAGGNAIDGSVQDFRTKTDFTSIVRTKAELPAAKHWRHLFRPLPLYGEHAAADAFAVKQIEDQRIASMVYLGVPDPRAISDYDFARIAFLDDGGESSVGSYSNDFLKEWEKKYAYDRFWQRVPSEGATKGVREHNETMTTSNPWPNWCGPRERKWRRRTPRFPAARSRRGRGRCPNARPWTSRSTPQSLTR